MRLILPLAFASSLIAGSATAEPCALDRTFRDSGIARDPAPQSLGKFDAVARDPRGGYLAAGAGDTGEAPYFTVVFVARYLPNGALDPGYGNAGFARWQEVPEDGTPDNAAQSKVQGIAVAADGSVLVLGYQVLASAALDLQLWRFSPSGALDTDYGDNGVSHLRCGASPFDAFAFTLPHLMVDEAGRALVTLGQGSAVVALRLRSDGSADPVFGTTAPGCSRFDRNIRWPGGIVRRPSGYEIAGGSSGQLWSLRFDDVGAPDPGYGIAGLVTVSAPSLGVVRSAALQGNRIVLGTTSGYDLAAVRLETTGALDATFAGGGIRSVPMPDREFDTAFAQDIAVAGDGRLAVVGLYDETADPQEMLVALLDPDGQDPAAGCDAGNRIALPPKGATARALGATFDGDRLVVVGGASDRGYVRDETAVAVLAPGVLFRNGFD